MWQHRTFLAVWSTFAIILSSPALMQSRPGILKPGDSLPTLAGQTLAGTWLSVDALADHSPVVVILSFSRAGGRGAREWEERLSKDNPGLAKCTIIFLETVPRLLRPVVVSGIKRSMPASLQSRTILLYEQQDLWRQRLQVNDDNSASVILLRAGGQVQWTTSAAFDDKTYLSLRQQIDALN